MTMLGEGESAALPVPAPGALVLALDAAGGSCSVALGRVRASRADPRGVDLLGANRREMQHGHATALVPMIEETMRMAAVAMADLDFLAVGIGPGGFTGLRIALATARGLGLALRKPVIGISSFQAAAVHVPPEDRAGGDSIILLDSRRSEPYAAWLGADLSFRADPVLLGEAGLAALIQQAHPTLIAGDGLGLWPHPFPAGSRQVEASADAAGILGLAADPTGAFVRPAQPFYLREPDVSLPKAV